MLRINGKVCIQYVLNFMGSVNQKVIYRIQKEGTVKILTFAFPVLLVYKDEKRR